ncbi:sensor histidine kinase [Paenibacillus crassostreae]|uniref:histidine kinase n=1 Tax=Paenibacillus crassostreae TaxID=1763538 RepID=A0A167DX20_9BACL|nr:HAMP domain-containing sensor histidine kinase [Paenibacillus crassostreae]AOZ90959.1 hypothetical protein LPB68_01245 [Paenibacillus crassostreae]OAB74878.1 hypothetical protein PNBC_12710 [Paenibacillus crassostreae]
MNGKSVIVKLFTLTSSVFIVLFLLMYVGQLVFFEDFYKYRELKSLEKNTRAFADQYEKSTDELNRINALSAFLNDNKAQIVVVDKSGNYLFDNPFKIVITLENGQEITIPLYVYPHSGELENTGLKIGDTISVTGLFQYEGNKEIFYSTQITKNDGALISRRTEHSQTSMQVLTGRIVHIILPRADQWNIREGILNFAIIGNFPLADTELQMLESGEAITKEWTEPWSNAENLILLHPILEEGNLSSIAMVVSSVAELDTTYASLRIYYLYFGAGGILLILLLSVFYSKVVAKPLLKINDMAKRLERMDFSVITPLQCNDEFGMLSRNLTSLAGKLDVALSQLREMNSQLLSDIEQKEQLERIQHAFISDISHELKTPLSIIRSYAEGLRDRVAEDRKRLYTDTIIDECKRMEELILNMLMLMRYDSEMNLFHPEACSLKELLERVIRLMKEQLNGSELELVFKAEQNYIVYVDPVLVERIMLNLISNAIRHAYPESTITISVEEFSSQTVRVAVKNQGNSIAEEHMQRIWDRFYQVAESRSRNMSGSGLGLAIVKQIVNDHGQSCGSCNTDEGVVFWFTLEMFLEEE